jgi:hypothetical protein
MSPDDPTAAWLARLQFCGILAGLESFGLERTQGVDYARFRWHVPDTRRPGDWFPAVIVVPLDRSRPETWDRALLTQLADSLGHELGEAVRRDGQTVADPHAIPRVWPWRVEDREER